jgi:hypothetical protein
MRRSTSFQARITAIRRTMSADFLSSHRQVSLASCDFNSIDPGSSGCQRRKTRLRLAHAWLRVCTLSAQYFFLTGRDIDVQRLFQQARSPNFLEDKAVAGSMKNKPPPVSPRSMPGRRAFHGGVLFQCCFRSSPDGGSARGEHSSSCFARPPI